MKQSTVNSIKKSWDAARPLTEGLLMCVFLVCLLKLSPWALGAWACYRWADAVGKGEL